MTASERLLIVGPSWVGDMVMAQSLYRELRERRPQVELDVLAPAWSLPVLERMPEVSRGIEMPVGHGELGLIRRFRLGRSLRATGYAQAIVLPRSLKAALVPFFARIPRRTGYLGEHRYALINDIRPFDPEQLDQTVRRFVALGKDDDSAPLDRLPNPELDVDPAALATLERSLRLDLSRPIVALMPGAEYGPAKQWPAPRFAALADELAARGCSVWILGSARERALGDEIAGVGDGDRVRNLCGETTIAQVIDLLAAAKVAVTNDSGLMHVAAAVGTEVIAIYGSSSPDYTPPLTEHRTVLYRALDCSPCFERTCPLGHTRCLTEIPVGQVLAAVERGLQTG